MISAALLFLGTHCRVKAPGGEGDACEDGQGDCQPPLECSSFVCISPPPPPPPPPPPCPQVDAGVCGILGTEFVCQAGQQLDYAGTGACMESGTTDAGAVHCCGQIDECAQAPIPSSLCASPSLPFQCLGNAVPVLACAELGEDFGLASYCCLSGKACSVAPEGVAATACALGTTSAYLCSASATPPSSGPCSVIALPAGASLHCCTSTDGG